MLQGFPPPEEMPDSPGFLKQLGCTLATKSVEPKPLGRLDSTLSTEEAEVINATGQVYDCQFTRLRINGVTYRSYPFMERTTETA